MRARAAWAFAAVNLAVIVAGVVLAAGVGGFDVLSVAILIAFSATGAMIATRQPRNPIGWLFLGVGMAAALATFSHGYADHGLAGGGEPGALVKAAAWYSGLSWIAMVLPGSTFLLLLFPDGRPPSGRWRAVAWCTGLGFVGPVLGSGLSPGPLDDYPQIANPYGWSSPVVDGLEALAALLLLVALIGCPASLAVRFRRASHEQRQQIKWLAFAGAVAAATFVLGNVSVAFVEGDPVVIYAAIMTSVLGLPIAAGIAILRHRLFDIDVVINRALVYAGLTGTLAAAYLGTVLLLQLALRPLTSRSDLAIAGSTLAVAALFGPARRRIQAGVDRRFYRRRYDAARTLEAFGARLRDQVDLDALGGDLRTVVADTMQPAHVSLWLREGRS